MKKGHVILTSGAALLVIGIAISAAWGISFAGSFMASNIILSQTSIAPGESATMKTAVNALDGRPLSLAIGIDKRQQPSSEDIRLKEMVTGPDGKVVSSNEFQESFFTSVNPETTGIYTATVSNLGPKTVTVSGTFGYMPFMESGGRPNFGSMMSAGGFGMMIAGGTLTAVGVGALIIGGIVTALDGRKGTTTTTTEGGITYRKD